LFNTQIINGFNIQIRFDTYLRTQIINPNTNINWFFIFYYLNHISSSMLEWSTNKTKE
jgi:hypothetical protein